MTVVETEAGLVRGQLLAGSTVFRGIPFARSPVGSLRWQPPQPAEQWTGVRDAQTFGPMVPQVPIPFPMFALDGLMSESGCLTVNVWTPAADALQRPVLVWIHGGAYSGGVGSLAGGSPLMRNDGARLAARGDVVVVTLNYRIGPFGFLRLTDLTDGEIASSGNEGLLDQVAALQWVRNNIAGFGGDPNNVTIVGQSAGGMSVGTLLAMPSARGLFHKAVVQSGGAHMCTNVARANAYAERLLHAVGVDPRHPEALADLPSDRLVEAFSTVREGLQLEPFDAALGPGSFAGSPVVDGHSIPELPIDAVRSGRGARVPLLVGSTLDEFRIFSLLPSFPPTIEAALLPMLLSVGFQGHDHAPIVEAYTAARAARGAGVSPEDLYYAIESDRNFRMPGVRLAEAMDGLGEPVYSYLFTWPSPAFEGGLGSPHGIDVGFLFGTHADDDVAASFSGSSRAADVLSETMQDSWSSFAREGKPFSESTGVWPTYGEEHRTMILGAQMRVELDPLGEERLAWDSQPDRLIGGFA